MKKIDGELEEKDETVRMEAEEEVKLENLEAKNQREEKNDEQMEESNNQAEEKDEEMQDIDNSTESSGFISDEDEASLLGCDDELDLEKPLSEEEIEELISDLLEVESKAAEAQEALEKESLSKVESEVREELAQTLDGDELNKAVAVEMMNFKDEWEATLDELETECANLLEQLDGAGIELPKLYAMIESQAPSGCYTEAWKQRAHWVGTQATRETVESVSSAEKFLHTHRPVRKRHGKLLEEGASGFLEKKLADSDVKECLAETSELDWSSLNKIFSEKKDKAISFGSKHWASVYLASTPQQAAAMGLEFPGVNEVEEIEEMDANYQLTIGAVIGNQTAARQESVTSKDGDRTPAATLVEGEQTNATRKADKRPVSIYDSSSATPKFIRFQYAGDNFTKDPEACGELMYSIRENTISFPLLQDLTYPDLYRAIARNDVKTKALTNELISRYEDDAAADSEKIEKLKAELAEEKIKSAFLKNEVACLKNELAAERTKSASKGEVARLKDELASKKKNCSKAVALYDEQRKLCRQMNAQFKIFRERFERLRRRLIYLAETKEITDMLCEIKGTLEVFELFRERNIKVPQSMLDSVGKVIKEYEDRFQKFVVVELDDRDLRPLDDSSDSSS